ncbi:MAG: zinc-ribbon domain-containing protein [Syntrophaceae bacterium]|nr:zinc-ribbon domain-containing protein [Syntrophaceae bacterium]
MIIQCRQCRTKFRFDDSLMQGSGVWLRCSRCGHVYFQENPYANKPPADAVVGLEPEIVSSKEEVIPAEEMSKIPEETPSVFYRDEQGMKSLDKIMEARKRLREEIDLDIKNTRGEIFGDGAEKVEDVEGTEGAEKIKKNKKKKKFSPKGSGKAWKITVWSVFVILIIPLFIYFYAFPQYGEQLVNNGKYIIEKFNEYRGVSKPVTSGAFINQMVKLQDVRYRRINNYVLGQIGVLEGTAVNRADYPLSRIQVKGEIVDAYSVVLGERASYAGNILSDEELMNLSEEEIIMKLLRPEGLNNSNDRVMPNGRIPFMIVFPYEPSGIIKTTVMTFGAERLL